MRRLIACLALMATACAPPGGYPLPDDPPTTWAYVPVAVGNPGWTVVLYLEPRPGDRLELLGAEPLGLDDGASVEFFLSRPVVEANGDRLLGEHRETLVGSVVVGPPAGTATGPDHIVGILAEITPTRPGRFVLASVRLRYRLNGDGDRIGEGIDTMLIVCADASAPTECAVGDEQG